MGMPGKHEVNIFAEVKRIIFRTVRKKILKPALPLEHAYRFQYVHMIERDIVHPREVDLAFPHGDMGHIARVQHPDAVLFHDSLDTPVKIAFVVARHEIGRGNAARARAKRRV